MVINKKTARFFLIINIMYVACDIYAFFYLKQTVLKDFTHPPKIVLSRYWNLFENVFFVLNFFIFSGLYWVLKVYRQKKFIGISIIIFCIDQLAMKELLYLLKRHFILFKYQYINLISGLSFILILFMIIAFFFAREKIIRKQLYAFSFLLLIATILPVYGPRLYDDYGYHWLLINKSFLLILPYIATLILFVEIYNKASAQIIADEHLSIEKNDDKEN